MTDRLRHQGGHSYDVDVVTDAVDAGGAHVTFVADAADSEVAPVLEGMWDELWRFADEGPTAEELAHDVEGVREHFDDPRSAEGIVASAAVRHLQGLPPQHRRERLRAAEALTAQDVAAAVRGALGGALALVPEDAPPLLSSVVELPTGTAERVTGRTCKRRLRADVPRGSRLVVGSEGVALVIGDEHVAVRYDDCVAVGVGVGDHAHVELVGGHGMTVVVRGDDWKDGAALVAEVLAQTRSVPRLQVQP